MDRGTPDAEQKPVPNRVLIDLRTDRGWGRPRLAKALDALCVSKGWSSPGLAALEKALYRLETGRVARPDEFYTRLLCEAYGKTAHDLFGDLSTAQAAGTANASELRSHKFIPVYVGPDGAAQLCEKLGMVREDSQWIECRRIAVDHPTGDCSLYVWPVGVAIYHLVEERQVSDVAELAVWRRSSYKQNMR